MRVLHTSDWHIGRMLYGRKRYDEFCQFLHWLSALIENEGIDALVVAGDIFDTITPSNRAQKLYYSFLRRVIRSPGCRHIVIIGGNHDSPSFLNAPRELLEGMNVHVVGAPTEKTEDEVITLCDDDNTPRLIVCAVPYLRDKDIRSVSAGETVEDKHQKLVQGIHAHYRDVCALAEEKRKDLEKAGYQDIPILATGHLFAAGGHTTEGDGVRDLYVGSLGVVGEGAFPDTISYLALGHLHIPQILGGKPHLRYCGSPIPMGFGEASHQKHVVIVDFENKDLRIREHPVPCFQKLFRLRGDLDSIRNKIQELKVDLQNAWVEIEYTGNKVTGDLREMLHAEVEGSSLEILRIKNNRIIETALSASDHLEELEELSTEEVFLRCLDDNQVPDADRKELLLTYQEILQVMNQGDVRAE